MYHRLPVRSTKMQWDYDMYLPQRMGKNSSHCAQVFAVQAFNPQTQMSPKDSLSPLTRVKLSIKAALWSFWVDFRFPGFWVTFSEAKLIGSWVEVHIVCFEFKLILINPCKLWNWGRLLKKYKREIKLFSHIPFILYTISPTLAEIFMGVRWHVTFIHWQRINIVKKPVF